MVKEYDIFILEDGTMRFIFEDPLRPLLEFGKSEITRASHVDMELVGDTWYWFADLSPISGPKLGPFIVRESAIAAEVEWLLENHLCKPLNTKAN